MNAPFDAFDFGPIWRSIPGTDMKRISQMRLYRLGNVTRLRELRPGMTHTEFLDKVTIIRILLKDFIDDPENQETVPAAVEKATNLFKDLARTYAIGRDLEQGEIDLFEGQIARFETSLNDDLARLPMFVVEPVGAYSFNQLINHADSVFPNSLRGGTIIPAQALEDFRKAGACLAFDLATACGFHAFRAADAMIRQYYAHFVHVTPKKKPRDWGAYIRVLRRVLTDPNEPKKPNIRTIELLDSIRTMDRNPVIHPELDLDSATALATFDLCKNVVLLMAQDIIATP